jgi:hypothetical protein
MASSLTESFERRVQISLLVSATTVYHQHRHHTIQASNFVFLILGHSLYRYEYVRLVASLICRCQVLLQVKTSCGSIQEKTRPPLGSFRDSERSGRFGSIQHKPEDQSVCLPENGRITKRLPR